MAASSVRRRPLVLTIAAVSVLHIGAFAATGFKLSHDARTSKLVIPAAADTSVVREQPAEGFGVARNITASASPGRQAEAYVAFDLPRDTPHFTGARMEVALDGPRPHQVELRELPTSWTENGTSWNNRPNAGAVIETADPTTGTIGFDVASVVRKPGRYAFAITSKDAGAAASVRSRESGDGPRLVLTTEGGSEKSVTATTPTLCGVSLDLKPGETFQNALSRMDGEFGGLATVRLYYPGVPPAWPGNPDTGNRPPIISFKLAPKDVLAGKYDEEMTRWFATAPRDRDLYWVYYHEPEDNIESGEFTAADYRAAWRRLRSLADKAANPHLHATLVLMSWSLDPLSKRNWRDYHPGRDVVQVLGWDAYNLSAKKGRYDDPATMYDRLVTASNGENLPFGIAETGSFLVKGDNGDRRAAWIRATNAYLKKHGALWIAYFDQNWETGDYRLKDPQSLTAWRESC